MKLKIRITMNNTRNTNISVRPTPALIPATPRAPKRYATIARTKKTMASHSRLPSGALWASSEVRVTNMAFSFAEKLKRRFELLVRSPDRHRGGTRRKIQIEVAMTVEGRVCKGCAMLWECLSQPSEDRSDRKEDYV